MLKNRFDISDGGVNGLASYFERLGDASVWLLSCNSQLAAPPAAMPFLREKVCEILLLGHLHDTVISRRTSRQKIISPDVAGDHQQEQRLAILAFRKKNYLKMFPEATPIEALLKLRSRCPPGAAYIADYSIFHSCFSSAALNKKIFDSAYIIKKAVLLYQAITFSAPSADEAALARKFNLVRRDVVSCVKESLELTRAISNLQDNAGRTGGFTSKFGTGMDQASQSTFCAVARSRLQAIEQFNLNLSSVLSGEYIL